MGTDAPETAPAYDPEAVWALVQRCRDDARRNTARLDRDKQDWLNMLMYRGGPDNQWVTWDSVSNVWRSLPTEGQYGLPEWVLRCSSNHFARHIDGICSILDQSEPAQEWRPKTDDDEDVATSEVVQDAMPVLLEEIDYTQLRPLLNKHAVLTDKPAVVVWWDNDERWGSEELPILTCESCGEFFSPAEVEEAGETCPKCGAVTAFPQALDPRTLPPTPATFGLPRGRMRADLLSSFEYSIPSSAREADADRVPWVLVHQRYSVEEARRLWPKHAARFADQGRSGGGTDLSRQYADALQFLSSPHAASSGRASSTAANTGPVILRLYHDPIEDPEHRLSFPKGLYCACTEDGTVLDAGPLPLMDDEGNPIKPVIIRQYQGAPGTPFGKPCADDLVPLQVELNLARTLGFLILMHNAAPRTFVPLTTQLEDEITGQPNQTIRYRSMVPGDKPQTEPGIGMPAALQWWIENTTNDMQEISGLNSVLLGQRPEGDPTLGEVELLRERGLGTFKTPLARQIAFETKLSLRVLYLARQSAWAPRFKRIRGENGQWEITQFTAADLKGGVDVFVNPTSAWPESQLMQNLRIKQAIESGLLVPAQDPELQVQMLSDMDLAHLRPSMDVDRKQIAREIDRWKAARSPQQIQPPKPWINVPMHLALKKNFLKTEQFEQLEQANPPLAQAMVAHVQQLELMAAPPPMAAPGGPGAAPPGGDPLEAAIQAGALQPAGAKKDPMDEAVASGALVPAGAAPAAGQAAAPAAQPSGPAGPSVDQLTQAQMAAPMGPTAGGAA